MSKAGQFLGSGPRTMGRIGVAFRAFFAVMFGSVSADRVAAALAGESIDVPPPATPTEPVSVPKPKPSRNDAITLLAALQREARLVDLIQEPLSDYSDEQIGAAARDVLRDCREVLSRMLAIEPVMDAVEGETVESPAEIRPAHMRIVGNPAGDPPYQGRLVHAGWRATRCELPNWTGKMDDAQVIAPAEIEC